MINIYIKNDFIFDRVQRKRGLDYRTATPKYLKMLPMDNKNKMKMSIIIIIIIMMMMMMMIIIIIIIIIIIQIIIMIGEVLLQ